MKWIAFSILLFSSQSKATPKHLEVWFMSSSSATESIINIDKIQFSKAFVAKTCQKFGEYCFDPHIGLYKDDGGSEYVEFKEVEKNEKYNFIPPAESVEESLINCDKEKNMFDIFCGGKKKLKIVNNHKLEVWIDMSGTMRQVDSLTETGTCNRELFLKNLNSKCELNNKMKVHIFNESKRELGNFNQACLDTGLNNSKRLLQQIRSSEVETLIIMTDIFEASKEFVDTIEMELGGKVVGIDKPFYSSELKEKVSQVSSKCN